MERRSSNSVRIYYPEYSLEEVLKLLRERIPALREKLPLKLVSLFGSYAKGRETAASDIDLLVVYDADKRKDDYKLVWDTLRIPKLQIHVYTSNELKALSESGSHMPKEAIDKGVILLRVE